jgi:acyl-coenzyme A thioesterase PaaI-like protein
MLEPAPCAPVAPVAASAAPTATLAVDDVSQLVARQIPLAQLLRLTLQEASPSEVRVRLPFSPELTNHTGGLHAAAQSAAAETAALVLGYLLLPAAGVTCLSKAIDLRFRKVARGDLWATAQPERAASESATTLAARLTAEGKIDIPVLVALSDATGERIADGSIVINLRRL